MPSPTIIDVSLRDGGYLNHWQFSQAEIKTALTVATAAGVDLIEVGYLDDAKDLPATAACTAKDLEQWRKHTDKGLAGMIRPAVKNPEQVLQNRQGHFELLRIPVDLRAPQRAIRMAELCHHYGFSCTFNFTSANCFSLDRISECSRQSPKFLKAIYLADSRGSMRIEDVAPLIGAVRRGWSGAIGYHAHDNLGLAYKTTESALEAGCSWVDASIAGVGLGGRNLSLQAVFQLIQKRAKAPDKRSHSALKSAALHTQEKDIGLPPPGEELAIFQKGAQHNLRMEWIGPLINAFGLQTSFTVIDTLPVQNWFEPEDLQAFLTPSQWKKIQW